MSRTKHAPIYTICTCYPPYTFGSIIFKKQTSNKTFLNQFRKPLCMEHINEKDAAKTVLEMYCIDETCREIHHKERKITFPKN